MSHLQHSEMTAQRVQKMVKFFHNPLKMLPRQILRVRTRFPHLRQKIWCGSVENVKVLTLSSNTLFYCRLCCLLLKRKRQYLAVGTCSRQVTVIAPLSMKKLKMGPVCEVCSTTLFDVLRAFQSVHWRAKYIFLLNICTFDKNIFVQVLCLHSQCVTITKLL